MNSYVDLVRTAQHPESYEAQPPRALTTVDGLYDWLRDAQFRCVTCVRVCVRALIHS